MYVLSENFTGESVAEKYEKVSNIINGSADMLIVSTLDDIAWLTNMRGDDIDFNPVFISYLIFHDKITDSNDTDSVEGYNVDLFMSKS